MNTETAAAELLHSLEKIIRGKTDTLRLFIAAYLTGTHVLLEDVPGVGKTTLVKTCALLIEKDGQPARFRRIQCTPDLLPYDITGVEIFNAEKQTFEFIEGPVFTDILLADELNRTPPKVQSALLEAMAERQVSTGTVTRHLPPYFFTAATQNPIESLGVYPLPTAQLDRFGLCLSLGYPDENAEIELLHEHTVSKTTDTIRPVIAMQDVASSRREQENVFVHPAILQIIARLAKTTRTHPAFKLGISPRAGLHLLKLARTLALVNGRNWVEDSDIRTLAPPVLAHRCMLAIGNGTVSDLIREITETVIRATDKQTAWTKTP